MIDLFKKSVPFLAIGLVLLIFLIITKEKDSEPNDLSSISAGSEHNQNNTITAEESSQFAVIDIKGAVNKPGVYELDISKRINDVIQIAGGFTNTADETAVNLAQKVQDEMVIIVPEIGEQIAREDSSGNDPDKIRINFASQQEIETLSGIGPAKAQAIIQYREENGLFQKVEDLLDIPGIGEKTLENIREHIQIP